VDHVNRTGRRREVISGMRITQEALDRLCLLHQRYMGGKPQGRRMALRDCDLSGLSLEGRDLSEAEMVSCNFQGSNLRGAVFRRALLLGSQMDEADLTGADFHRADLRGVRFDKAVLSEAMFHDADLGQAMVMRVLDDSNDITGGGSRFRGAIMRDVNLSQCKLKDADFSGACLENADLSGADLRHATLHRAALGGVSLKGAHISDADFRGADFGDGSSVQEIDFSACKTGHALPLDPKELRRRLESHRLWAESDGREGEPQSWEAVDLSGEDLRGANLSAANLKGAVLRETNLKGAILAAARLQGADLSRANLAETDLRGTNFHKAKLRGANLKDARTGELPGTGLITHFDEDAGPTHSGRA